ncbi:hypothetical protein BGX33_005192 [Mortierella sp. NVP41]|nr:hypothetical protein BGX33_005192 [Mortierella sp. NVP41]
MNYRQFVIDYHDIAYKPETTWRAFWRKEWPRLHELRNPALQLVYKPKPPNPIDGNFTLPLFTASYELLWSERDKDYHGGRSVLARGINERKRRSWIMALLWMIWHKLKLKPTAMIKCHDLPLNALKSPDLVALIEFKWNKMGLKYWLARFLFQCLYYALVLFAVFAEIYRNPAIDLVPVFGAIIVTSTIFLWLEIIQFCHDMKAYISSIYNYIDVFAFSLPLMASINQLLSMYFDLDNIFNPNLLSFGILIIALHFLFELRAIKMVCFFVTTISHVVYRIKVFFFIFAGRIMTFTVSFMHLTSSCNTENCPPPRAGTSTNFLQSFFSTFFFMVPLINFAFKDSDRTWELIWLENRLRIIETAENTSYHIPGFRDAHDWFPRKIYYSATIQTVNEYEEETKRPFPGTLGPFDMASELATTGTNGASYSGINRRHSWLTRSHDTEEDRPRTTQHQYQHQHSERTIESLDHELRVLREEYQTFQMDMRTMMTQLLRQAERRRSLPDD